MERRTDWEDELAELVTETAEDIAFDYVNEYKGPVEVREVDSGTDDGMVYGTYDLYVKGYVITVKAQAVFEGFQDCWDYSSESHYTKPVYFESLEDFSFDIERVYKEPEEPKELDLDK